MDTRERALQLISEVCGVERDSLEPSTQLVADLGVDSARALHLLVKLEDQLDIEIEDEVVAEMQTVGDILAFLEAREGADQAGQGAEGQTRI